MLQNQLFENIVRSQVNSLNLPGNLSEELTTSIIKSVEKGKLIFPGVYRRRFDITLKQFAIIMDKLIEYKFVQLRFKIDIEDINSSSLYKLSNIPVTIYNEEKDIDVCIDFEKHISPVYEVIK